MRTAGFLFRGMNLTTKLIIANVSLFLTSLILASFIPNFFDYVALKPGLVVHGTYLWTLLTSMFMHGSFYHLIFNMFSLYFIGTFVERIIGRKRLLWFYLLSGLFAGIVFAVLAGFFGVGFWARVFGDSNISGVGASGAIFGLLGLLAVIVPRSRVYLIAGPLIAIVIQFILGLFVTNTAMLGVISFIFGVYIIISIFSIFSIRRGSRSIALPIEMPFWLLPIVAIIPLIIVGLFFPLPIGNTAHFGGLIAGLIYGFYLRRKYKKKVELLRRHFR